MYGDETEDREDQEDRKPLTTTNSKSAKLRRSLTDDAKAVKKRLTHLYDFVTKNAKLWAWLNLMSTVLIVIIFCLILIIQANDPYNSTYGLHYYLVPAIVPTIVYTLGLGYSIQGSKKSFIYKGVIIAGVISNALSASLMVFGVVKIIDTIVQCYSIIGVPTTVPTSVWILSVSTALCGGVAGQRAVGIALLYVLIWVIELFWIATGAILIQNSRKIEDINSKNDQVDGQMEMESKGKYHNNEDHHDEIFERTHIGPFTRHNVTHKYVLDMSPDELDSHIGCSTKVETDTLASENFKTAVIDKV